MVVKHPESIQWLKDAGFVKLCAGVESGSDRILKTINKGITVEMNTKARQIIADAEIHYEAFMILGHPGETIQDINETTNWLLENKPDDFDLNLLTPYPGSKIYDDAIPSNRFKSYNWEYKGLFFNKIRYAYEDSYYKGIDKQSKSNIRTLTISNKRYIELRNSIDKYVGEKLK